MQAPFTFDDKVNCTWRHRRKYGHYFSDRFVRDSVLLVLLSYNCVSGSTALLIYCVPAQKPRCHRYDINDFTLNTSACGRLGLHATSRERLLHLLNLHLYFIHSFVSSRKWGLIRVYAQRGLLPSVVLPLHIAKAEERLCTVILVNVFCTVSIVIWYILVIIIDGNYEAIKGKFYPNSLVVDSFKDDLWLMYENIDTCWGIFVV